MTKTRIVSKRYAKGRRRSSSDVAWWKIFVIFVIVCGLLMLIMGRGSGCGSEEESKAVARKIVEALDRTQRADRALEAGNYGDARHHVRKTQAKLTEVLAKLQEVGK